jgi:hypothetical protein
MGHPILFWITLILAIIISLYLFVLFSRGVATDDDYLEVLSFTEWKSGWTIHSELENLLGKSVSLSSFYVTLLRLTREGFVEKREINNEDGPTLEFRKIRNRGGGRRDEVKYPTLNANAQPA